MSITDHVKLVFKTRVMATIVGMFLMSAWFSCTEVKYFLWGESAEAVVTSVRKSHYKSRDEQELALVTYSWQEKGGLSRKDETRVRMYAAPAQGDTFTIDYLPGAKGSRPHGERNYGALTIFFGFTGLVILVFGRLVWVGSR